MNAVHPLQTSSRRWLPLQSAEWALLAAAVALLAFAVWGPFLPASVTCPLPHRIAVCCEYS